MLFNSLPISFHLVKCRVWLYFYSSPFFSGGEKESKSDELVTYWNMAMHVHQAHSIPHHIKYSCVYGPNLQCTNRKIHFVLFLSKLLLASIVYSTVSIMYINRVHSILFRIGFQSLFNTKPLHLNDIHTP